MSAPSDTTPIPEVVRERAAFWHVRLASDEARETDWLDFEAWLGEHPVHQRAYEAVGQVWADLDAAPASATTNIAPLRPRPSRRGFLRTGALAASLVATAVVGATFWANTPRTRGLRNASRPASGGGLGGRHADHNQRRIASDRHVGASRAASGDGRRGGRLRRRQGS